MAKVQSDQEQLVRKRSALASQRESDRARILLPANRAQFLITTTGCALIFIAMLVGMQNSTWFVTLDERLSRGVQQLRSGMLDSFVVGITMLGDTRATLSCMAALLALLACARRWWLMCHLAAVFFASRLAVPLLKLTFERDRPSSLYGGLESYSFPSGHTAAAMTLFGIIALISCRAVPASRARWILGVFSLLILSVALSRVYLLAHWPSDIIASLALGLPFVLAFGWQLQQHPIVARWFTPAMLGIVLAFLAIHLWLAYPLEVQRYLA